MIRCYLFAHHHDGNLSSVRRAAVFEEKNALPGAELHFSIDNWHRFAGAGQDHADVRRHVVAAFGSVSEVIGILRDEAVKEFFQVAARGRIGILHNDKAATGVLNKDGHRPIADTGPVDLGLHFVRDLVQPLAIGASFKSIVADAHW